MVVAAASLASARRPSAEVAKAAVADVAEAPTAAPEVAERRTITLKIEKGAQKINVLEAPVREQRPSSSGTSVATPNSPAESIPTVVGDGLAGHAATPVAIVEKGSLPGERTILTTLRDLPEAIAREAVAGPAVIVIGEVVRYAPAQVCGLALEAERAAA